MLLNHHAAMVTLLLASCSQSRCTCTSETCWSDFSSERSSHEIPVVMIHWGLHDCSHCDANPPFLQHSIDVARRAGNRVLLLGDDSNKLVKGAEWHDVSLYMDGARDFARVYQHLSSNPHSYEMACFQRMFVLRDFLRNLRFQAVLHVDSDVLVIANITDAIDAECVGDGGGAWLRPIQDYNDWWWVESVATALFSLPLIEDLCDFMIDLYTTPAGVSLLQKKMDGWVVERGGEGGVCDMTAYFLFSNCMSTSSPESSAHPNRFPDPELICPRARRLVDVGDLTGEWSAARRASSDAEAFGSVRTCTRYGVFDLNINEGSGFKMACDDEEQKQGCIKAVSFIDGAAWGQKSDSEGGTHLLSLHLQGAAKGRVESLASLFYAAMGQQAA